MATLKKIIFKILSLRFMKAGGNLIFSPASSSFSYNNIILGCDVFIGPKAWFRASHSYIRIGDGVMFGPGVSILAGNHRFNIVGESIRFLKKNSDWNDKDIVIENEVWVGANVIILDGVTIGRGSIIGAGAVVTKSIPEYTIAAGNPCVPIRKRFTSKQVQEHEFKLYKK